MRSSHTLLSLHPTTRNAKNSDGNGPGRSAVPVVPAPPVSRSGCALRGCGHLISRQHALRCAARHTSDHSECGACPARAHSRAGGNGGARRGPCAGAPSAVRFVGVGGRGCMHFPVVRRRFANPGLSHGTWLMPSLTHQPISSLLHVRHHRHGTSGQCEGPGTRGLGSVGTV